MSTMLVDTARLTPEQLVALAPALRDAMKDRSYELLPLGEDVAAYMRSKRKRLTPASERSYESCLDKLARAFPDLKVEDFEPPIGSQRLEQWMDDRWGRNHTPGTYNVNHAILSDFFKFWRIRGRLHGDPMLAIDKAKKRTPRRTVFSDEQRHAIIGNAVELRDRIALRLLFDYGLRKGALKGIRFKHFDHGRRRLTIATKGGKIRALPLPDPQLWLEIERLVLDWEAAPGDLLMCVIKPIPRAGMRRFPDREMASTTVHRWWMARLADAGLVERGATGTAREMNMHAARHTAGQRMLDKTGNVKAVQRLLGHASMTTTADVYVDVDIDQLSRSLLETLAGDGE